MWRETSLRRFSKKQGRAFWGSSRRRTVPTAFSATPATAAPTTTASRSLPNEFTDTSSNTHSLDSGCYIVKFNVEGTGSGSGSDSGSGSASARFFGIISMTDDTAEFSERGEGCMLAAKGG